MSGVWEEVKTRKIFKAATYYAAIAWGIIQIADILLPVLGIEDWVMSSMVLVAFAGFPIALISGWMFDIKLDRKNALAESEGQIAKATIATRVFELVVIGAFGMSAAFLYYNSASEPVSASIAETSNIQSVIKTNEEQKTIAVLPFASFSDSQDDEFFADGLSEELLNVLARNKKLRVAARTSSFQYKKTNINVKTIAHELGVQYILEGSVRRSGDLIRVTAQLIKADEDVHVFSKSWDRDTSNVFQVQDEIAQSVSNELKISLLGETDSTGSEIGTKNIAAFAEYSKGLAYLRNRGKTDFENAIANFSKALEIDPNYSEAMAMLAETYLLQVSYSIVKFEDAQSLAKPLIQNALKLNPELGAAHAVKGLFHWQLAGHDDENSDKELETAKSHLAKAINLNPSIAEAYMWYGSILQKQGEFIDGAELRKKAFELDPRAAVVGYNRAKDLVRIGDYKEAMDVFNVVIRNNPNYPNAYEIAGDVSMAVGQLDQAFGMYNRLSELSDDQTSWLINSSRIFIPMGEFERAQSNVDELNNMHVGKYGDKFDWLQAFIWLASRDYASFKQWTNEFEEQTKSPWERHWRGISLVIDKKWKYAVEDLSRALELLREKNEKRVDDDTVRIQLFLATAYKKLGDQIKSDGYLDAVQREIETIRARGISGQMVRYQEAALTALRGDQQKAIALLRQSIQEGFVDFWWADTDPAFEDTRKDPMFTIIKDEFNIRMRLMQNNIESQYGKFAVGI